MILTIGILSTFIILLIVAVLMLSSDNERYIATIYRLEEELQMINKVVDRKATISDMDKAKGIAKKVFKLFSDYSTLRTNYGFLEDELNTIKEREKKAQRKYYEKNKEKINARARAKYHAKKKLKHIGKELEEIILLLTIQTLLENGEKRKTISKLIDNFIYGDINNERNKI